MAGPDFLSQLPSFDELLEHPKVAAAIERLNQSTAASRVRGAVSGLSAEIARRAEEIQGLTPGELLDRVVRRIDEPPRAATGPIINATGRVTGPKWAQTPLPAVAIEAMMASAQTYAETAPGAAAEAAKQLLGCEAATVFSSPAAGLIAALEALAAGGFCLIARGEMDELAPGVRLDALCQRAGVGLREVGATDCTTIDDYRAALPTEGAPTVVLRRGDLASEPSVSELASLPNVTVLVDAGGARPKADTPTGARAVLSAEELMQQGADAVLIDTKGWIGGPPAGLLVGRSKAIDRVAASASGRADQLAPMIDAALAATLDLFGKPETLRFAHPLYELTDAPIESLRNRAERLAPQIAAGEGVAAAEPVERPGPTPSWAVRIEPLPGATSADLLARLASMKPGIHAAEEDQAVLIDLRSVFAREDRALAAAFRPEPPEDPPAATAPGV